MTPFLLSSLIKTALAEDLGQGGDITSLATIPIDHQSRAGFVARGNGVLCGLDVARQVFETVDRSVQCTVQSQDGDQVEAGTVLMTVQGSTRSILQAERVALNFMSHLSGIATATRELVDLVAHTKAKITSTRKTTPGLRALEKYAVRSGGGVNHRVDLSGGILIKDNHIAALGGDIVLAVQRARDYAGPLTKIEVEIDRLDQIAAALQSGADVIMLDNMTPEQLQKSVAMIGGKALTEASGRVNRTTVKAIADSGVDFISVGAITHSAPILDIGLDWL